MPITIRDASSSCLLALMFALAGCGGGYSSRSAEAPVARAYPPSQLAAPMPSGDAVATPEPVTAEHHADYGVNPFVETQRDRLSTFSIDVDTASYSFARRKLVQEDTLPPAASVRAEEFLNSFDYGYPTPDAQEKVPFNVHFAAAPSPFAEGRHIVRIGAQAKRVSIQERQPVHLVYLVDVSGSMSSPERLPLAKKSLALLTDTLKPGDTVALCTYAGSTRVVLEPTGIEHRAKILSGIASLDAGGGTAMSSGVQMAYDLASKTLVKGHLNRVVVLSDGDANIGDSSHEQILKTIEQHKNKGITLSTVGFGSGNYKDMMMEQLADKGDGNYTYIDSEDEARKVFTEQVDGLLQVVARDVKIQVEFDPSIVRRYRLIGYENRDIADRDFRNDKVDAGEVGSGHSVTALYDVELVNPKQIAASPLVVRMRHKPAKNALHGGSDEAIESAFAMPASAIHASFEEAPESYRFAVAVGGFAEVLRKSPHAASVPLENVERIAAASTQGRRERVELVGLVQKATKLAGKQRGAPIAR
ncbi:MAG: von Willebrand factor type A domain-containing protein [Labilithrix sp.]|nr:von Willebrand factor type A domain-containing protein [Labilithrix sp.]